MARLTIEQKWWIDPRRTFLQSNIDQPDAVDGIMVHLWRIAQEYYGSGTLLPFRVFSKIRNYQAILDADLAEIRLGPEIDSPLLPEQMTATAEHFVYVRGSKDFFSWIFDIREKRAIAGRLSAEARKAKFGSAVPTNATNTEQKPNKNRTKVSKTEVSGSGSGLDSNAVAAKKTRTREKPSPPVEYQNHLELIESLSPKYRSAIKKKYDLDWVLEEAERCFSYYALEHPDDCPETKKAWISAFGGWIRRAKNPVLVGQGNVPANSTISGVSHDF